eukprot:6310914-Lingulodinium_polyedra.AAC.1
MVQQRLPNISTWRCPAPPSTSVFIFYVVGAAGQYSRCIGVVGVYAVDFLSVESDDPEGPPTSCVCEGKCVDYVIILCRVRYRQGRDGSAAMDQ